MVLILELCSRTLPRPVTIADVGSSLGTPDAAPVGPVSALAHTVSVTLLCSVVQMNTT